MLGLQSNENRGAGALVPVVAAIAAAALGFFGHKAATWRRDKYDGMDSLVSYSSRLIAAARAMEDDETEEGRLVDDPLAKHLAGLSAMKQAKARRTRAPEGLGRTYMVSRLAVRTRWFDDQLEECLGMPDSYRSSSQRGHIVSTLGIVKDDSPAGFGPALTTQQSMVFPTQVVELGAGLSTRPWRLHLPASLKWFDVDRQDVIDAKEDVLLGLGAEVEIMSPMRRSHSNNALLERQIGSLTGTNHNHRAVEYPLRCDERMSVTADLGHPSWMRSLLEAGFDPNKPTVWIAEGLLMYLEPARVDALLKELAAISVQGSSILTAVVTEKCIRRLSEDRAKGKSSLMDEWKSGCPEDPMAWLGGLGWSPLLATTRAEIANALGLPGEVCSFPTETDRGLVEPQGYFLVGTILA
jgi:O-methyltransferase involved in polyketide biosynthesis